MHRDDVESSVTMQLVSVTPEYEFAGTNKKLHDPNPPLQFSTALKQQHELVFLGITLLYSLTVAGTEWECSFLRNGNKETGTLKILFRRKKRLKWE